MMRIAAFLLVAVLLSTCVISGTFAKYASNFSGSDTVTAAKWDVKVEGSGNESFAFNLFDTIKDIAGATEEDVKAGLIAPGTEGSFQFNLTAANEVTTKYSISFAITNAANIPLQYRVNGGEWKTTLDTIEETILLAAAESFTKDVTVEWKWAFNESGVDNAYSGATVTVVANVAFVQID